MPLINIFKNGEEEKIPKQLGYILGNHVLKSFIDQGLLKSDSGNLNLKKQIAKNGFDFVLKAGKAYMSNSPEYRIYPSPNQTIEEIIESSGGFSKINLDGTLEIPNNRIVYCQLDISVDSQITDPKEKKFHGPKYLIFSGKSGFARSFIQVEALADYSGQLDFVSFENKDENKKKIWVKIHSKDFNTIIYPTLNVTQGFLGHNILSPMDLFELNKLYQSEDWIKKKMEDDITDPRSIEQPNNVLTYVDLRGNEGETVALRARREEALTVDLFKIYNSDGFQYQSSDYFEELKIENGKFRAKFPDSLLMRGCEFFDFPNYLMGFLSRYPNKVFGTSGVNSATAFHTTFCGQPMHEIDVFENKLFQPGVYVISDMKLFYVLTDQLETEKVGSYIGQKGIKASKWFKSQ